MNTLPLQDVPYHDSKRHLALYNCQICDHLAVQEWLDRHLRGDYLFKKNHIASIIKRETSKMYAVMLDGMYVGTVVYYHDSVLHNIMIAEEFRGLGIGEAVIRYLAPLVIRAKTNMKAGDPVPFYQRLGYEPVRLDADRPHIVVMEPPVVNTPRDGDGSRGITPSTPAAPVSSIPLNPPEMRQRLGSDDRNEEDAQKWRALKRRQRERQEKKKQQRKELDNAYASRYAHPGDSNVHSNGLAVHSLDLNNDLNTNSE